LKQVDHEELNRPFFLHDILRWNMWVRICATTTTQLLAKSISTAVHFAGKFRE